MSEEGATTAITVFLLADNRLLREALTRILNKKNEMHVLAAVPASREILDQIYSTSPQVLLLDSSGFDPDGLTIVMTARRRTPGLKVVMFGMEDDKDVFLRSVRAGVTGFLLKDASAAEIAGAVHAVVNDEAVCPPRLCFALLDQIARQEMPLSCVSGNGKFGLTRREQQLLQMISCGLSNKEIANDLNISDQTVKNHIHRILQKLGAADRMSAVEAYRGPMTVAS